MFSYKNRYEVELIRIISSNIRFDNPNDNEHKWCYRLPLLSDLINRSQPDILGTQEGWQPQLYELHSKLNNLSIIDSHRNWIEDRMYPTIFLNTSRFEVIESGDIWLSETPYTEASKSFNSAFPRLCTWCYCKDKLTQTENLFINVHLDHLETSTRQKQIEVLINEIQKVCKTDRVILMGDFNESPGQKVREIINNSSIDLKDPWLKFNKPEETSHHSFKGFREDGTRIDWILHTPNFIAKSIELLKDSHNGIYPSDHYPVLAIFN